MIKLVSAAIASLVLLPTAGNAVVTITIEAPGVENSTLALLAPAVQTFDALPVGIASAATLTSGGTVATIDTINILAANLYGGAGGTGHYGAVLGGHSTTVAFTGAPANYVGFYASAIDGASVVTLYSGATVLYSHVLPLIPLTPNHFGNPDAPFAGQDGSEGFAFFNITSTISISSIVFAQTSGGNLEFDNLTIASTAVPEPASWALMIAGFTLVGCSMRRRAPYATA